jgi:hypothetical protein
VEPQSGLGVVVGLGRHAGVTLRAAKGLRCHPSLFDNSYSPLRQPLQVPSSPPIHKDTPQLGQALAGSGGRAGGLARAPIGCGQVSRIRGDHVVPGSGRRR